MDRGNELSDPSTDSASSDQTGSDRPEPERQLEAARREAIYWLLSGLMHESRNALQQISACAEMLAIQLANHPIALDLVQGVEEAQGRLVQILDELRTYSAPLEPACRPLDLVESWRRAWQSLTSGDRWPHAELRQQAVPSDMRCQADPDMLAQTFATLLANALVGAGSSAIVEIASHETTLSGQAALAVVITDHGKDLTPAEQRQLFEPFFCRHPGSTGLGMAVARRLVELHGGSLHANAAAGRGAEVVLILLRQPTKKS